MTTEVKYYKAVRPNGRDFYSNTIQWDTIGEVVHHDEAEGAYERWSAASYLSVSVSATTCTGHQWPCRLLEVEPVEGFEPWTPDADRLPSKRAARAWRVVRELPAHQVFGPQGEQVAALIERVRNLPANELDRLASAWDAAWGATRGAAWDAAWGATRGAAWDAAWGATRGATRDAVLALLVRDLISTECYDKLSAPWRRTVGQIHPDDVDLKVPAV